MAIVDSFSELSDTIKQDIKKGVDILKGGGCESIYIFGSVAEGRVTDRSDIDFAVRGCPASEFYNLQGKLLLELTRSADLVDLDSDDDLASFLEREATLIHVG
ncbi:MAG: nucleotidyltransferase domain-containing protein [Candidatus Latescibacteria bacterium]|jgi:predicted nucleotidyltransferase|nr:nucleotidyltransferase domain-containing protein [Candidatus Latescibacterota bacterium]